MLLPNALACTPQAGKERSNNKLFHSQKNLEGSPHSPTKLHGRQWAPNLSCELSLLETWKSCKCSMCHQKTKCHMIPRRILWLQCICNLMSRMFLLAMGPLIYGAALQESPYTQMLHTWKGWWHLLQLPKFLCASSLGKSSLSTYHGQRENHHNASSSGISWFCGKPNWLHQKAGDNPLLPCPAGHLICLHEASW